MNESSTRPNTRSALAYRIAAEALTLARRCVDRQNPLGGGPIHLFADRDGTWDIHSTSKILRIDASVPLTSTTTASADALAAALILSFADHGDPA